MAAQLLKFLTGLGSERLILTLKNFCNARSFRFIIYESEFIFSVGALFCDQKTNKTQLPKFTNHQPNPDRLHKC